jgi:CubicO group peptidase (beta-lactamase class C family)
MSFQGTRCFRPQLLVLLTLLSLAGCNEPSMMAPVLPDSKPLPAPSFANALSTYFPPSEANGGWRKTTDAAKISSLGMNASALNAFGAYNMSLPWEKYGIPVSGYDASNKASIVVKNGWVVGEYYNKATARTGVYYLASNSKTFAMMVLGRLLLDYPSLGIGLDTPFYDERWLPEGFPLTDDRKADITFDHVLRHVSGIIPEAQASIADGPMSTNASWNFVPFTVGKDADYPVSAPLYYNPGQPSTYTKGRTYSSVAFNHFSLIFRNITGQEPSLYFRSALLNPIGVGRVAYRTTQGMGDYKWATAGSPLSSARDFARISYLLLHEGNWAGKEIFTASWIRNFTTVAGYPNIRSNVDCYWGSQYPKDMYRTVGSGLNWTLVVPSLDLVATLNGRTPNSMVNEVTDAFLQKLFAAVTQEYVTCDGRVVNGGNNVPTPPTVTALQLMNADTDQPIQPLTDGATITLADLPTTHLNVRAETSPTKVGSVRFGLDASANYRTETNAPYAMAGDDSGNYRAWTPRVGTHTVKATAYTGASATGTGGPTVSVTFTVK